MQSDDALVGSTRIGLPESFLATLILSALVREHSAVRSAVPLVSATRSEQAATPLTVDAVRKRWDRFLGLCGSRGHAEDKLFLLVH